MRPDARLNDPDAGKCQVSDQNRRYRGINYVKIADTIVIGAISQVRDNLSFDVGFRHAITNGAHVSEIRAGLTIGFPLRFFGGPSHVR